MGILTIEFLAFVVGALLLFHASRSSWWRRGVLSCASMVFVLSYAGNGRQMPWTLRGAESMLPLFAFALMGFVAMRAVKTLPVWLLALAVVAAYSSLRYATADPAPPHWIVTIGTSYILFRMLHLLFDHSQGELVVVPTLPDYLGFIFFFPTFLSGPVWRYEEYRESLNSSVANPLDSRRVFSAFSRIANGCLKVLVFAHICRVLHDIFVQTSVQTASNTQLSAISFMSAVVLYLIYFFFDFSGYMDIVIGVGVLFGLQFPENFNAPFQSTDIIDFWNRWHITLSKWMQQYLFTPLVARLSRSLLGYVGIQYLGTVGYLVVFLVVGLWHGVTLRFLCFGLTLGIAASLTKLWDSKVMKLVFSGKRGNAVRSHAAYKKTMNAFTILVVSLALSFLWVDPGILEQLDFFFCVCCLVAGMFMAASPSILERFFTGAVVLMDKPGSLKANSGILMFFASFASELWLAFRCIVVCGVLAVQDNDMPVFIYQGF